MPDDPGRALGDGRLNLEQQKKRAKDLLKGVRAGDDAALARLSEHHPRRLRPGAAAVHLADAQAAIAREAGFASWPRLKAHAERLGEARAAIQGRAAPDTPKTLHIRCGEDLRQALKRAGFVGAYHPFADPYCQGPVLDLPDAELIALRTGFIAEAYRLYPNVVRERLGGEYRVFTGGLQAWDEAVLWFEHDSYDQLTLARLLARLSREAPAYLVCADRVPGVARFVGLGQLAPEPLRLLWDQRVLIGPEHRDLGARVWRAFTEPTPLSLHQIANEGTPAVPPMAAMLQRQLRELPSARNGLSLTEQLTLDLLAEGGPAKAQGLFRALTREREPLPFLGDAMFWWVLRNLASGPAPLITAPPAGHHDTDWSDRTVRLTANGAAVQAGRADWLALGAPVRWLGGVELDPAGPCWRWDEDAGRPILTPSPRA